MRGSTARVTSTLGGKIRVKFGVKSWVRVGVMAGVTTALLGGCCDARLRGVVSDDTTGAPLAGAVVRSGAVEARADELGFFDLDGLACDDCWRVTVSAQGYNLLSTSVVPALGEDPRRLVRDLALVPLGAPARQERAPEVEAPPLEDYRPRHARVVPGVAPGVVPGEAPDQRLYIKLTEDQAQVLMQHVRAHGSEQFSRALRALIESLPRK